MGDGGGYPPYTSFLAPNLSSNWAWWWGGCGLECGLHWARLEALQIGWSVRSWWCWADCHPIPGPRPPGRSPWCQLPASPVSPGAGGWTQDQRPHPHPHPHPLPNQRSGCSASPLLTGGKPPEGSNQSQPIKTTE